MKNLIPALAVAIAITFSLETLSAQQASASDEHALLKKDVGVWNAKGKMWMPGAPEPIEFEGVETNEMLGELFVITDFRGDFGGMAFRGHGRVGFNPTTKKYESTWFDVTNPYGMTAEGTYDEATKTIKFKNKSKTPTGEDRASFSTHHYKDENTRVMKSFVPDPNGGDKLVPEMEIIYTRKK